LKALTLKIADRQDGQPGVDVVLREGAPGEAGVELARETRADLTADERAKLTGLRTTILGQTGKLPDLDARANLVGNLMLPGAVGAKWTALRDAVAADLVAWGRDRKKIPAGNQTTAERKAWADTRPGYRTYLQIATPRLEWIPWETARVGDDPVFLLDDMPVCRYRVMKSDRSVAEPGWQIRVLVVIGTADEAIKADAEVREIRSELRPLDRIYDIDVLRPASRKELSDKLSTYEPHVLHFIGHGTADHLMIRDQPWGRSQIATDIVPGKWVPEVVYLNACRSQNAGAETATTDDQDRQRTVVDAFLDRHVLAVVAMQADVRGSVAGACAAAFYGALLDKSPLDIACARGRARVSQIPGRDGTRDPYLPVLTLTVPAEKLLQHKTSIAPPAATGMTDRIHEFVDRYQERRSIVESFEFTTRKNVVVVRGAQDVGKSSLLCWAVDLCLRRDYPVRYLELGGYRDWLQVLRALVNGSGLPSVGAPLGSLVKPHFNWMLNNLAKGILEPTGAAGAQEVDEAPSLAEIESSKGTPANFGPLVGKALYDALATTADRPLVVAFDQLEAGDRGFSSDQLALLRANWIDPWVASGDGRVRVLLGMRSERKEDYRLDAPPETYRNTALFAFPKEEEHDLVRELFRFRLKTTTADGRPGDEAMLQELESELAMLGQESVDGRTLQDNVKQIVNFCARKIKARMGGK
jgi:hypothetical protein